MYGGPSGLLRLYSRGPVVLGRDRARFCGRQARVVAIAVTFETCRVVALVLGFRQCSGFRGSELGVVTGFEAVPAFGDVALVLGGRHVAGLSWGQFGVVAIAPAIAAIREVTPVFRGGRFNRFRQRQSGEI